MLDFEEELKKFHPSLEVQDAEEAIYSQEMTDLADAVMQILRKKEETDKKEK